MASIWESIDVSTPWMFYLGPYFKLIFDNTLKFSRQFLPEDKEIEDVSLNWQFETPKDKEKIQEIQNRAYFKMEPPENIDADQEFWDWIYHK